MSDATLAARITAALPDGAHARCYGEPVSVINIHAPSREVTPEDVAAARRAITGEGFTETKSWVATEGMSWLSTGVHSASIAVRRD